MYVCMCVCMHVCLQCMYACTCVCVCVCVHGERERGLQKKTKHPSILFFKTSVLGADTQTHPDTHTHTHTHTQTHRHTPSIWQPYRFPWAEQCWKKIFRIRTKFMPSCFKVKHLHTLVKCVCVCVYFVCVCVCVCDVC